LNYKPKGDGACEILPWHFDQAAGRKVLRKMLIKHELPLSFVEYEGFRDFVEVIQPLFKVHSRFTYQRDINKLYEAEKLVLHEFFTKSSPRISLTTDTWTSNKQISYMCLTSH
jgi:hypothetical protein